MSISQICLIIFFTEFFSYLLYIIVKEKEEGASESALATTVEKIMKEAGVRGVIVNSRIISVFRKKFGLPNADIKRKRKKCGGSSVKRLLGKWRDQTYKGHGSEYNFPFISRYSSPWTNSVRSSREVLEEIPSAGKEGCYPQYRMAATRHIIRYIPHGEFSFAFQSCLRLPQ